MNLPPPFSGGPLRSLRLVTIVALVAGLSSHTTTHLTDDEREPRAHTISDPILWDRKKKLGK